MGILRQQYERELEEEQKRKKKKGDEHPAKNRNGNHFPLVVLLVIFAIVIAFPMLQTFRSPIVQPMISLPSGLDFRATQLAEEQARIEDSMTRMASASTEQANALQQEMERRENALHTQIAEATATEAVHATATSFSLTQTPLAQEQILRNIELQKKQNDAYWSQWVSPLKVIGLAIFSGMCLVILLYMTVHAFWKLLPVYEARLRLIKERGDERSIHLGEGNITRVDLMHQPTLTEEHDGTMTPSGGAADPFMQERVAELAARVKAVQALPPGAKIPGNVPVTKVDDKILPELEVVEGHEIKPELLRDVRQSLDGEEGGS